MKGEEETCCGHSGMGVLVYIKHLWYKQEERGKWKVPRSRGRRLDKAGLGNGNHASDNQFRIPSGVEDTQMFLKLSPQLQSLWEQGVWLIHHICEITCRL